MAIEALCPTCGAVFNLKDEYEGKKVRCKKCEQIFTVGGEKPAARDDDDRGVTSKAGSAKNAARDDDDDERSSRKGRAAAKRGRDDDDDDDDRPKRKSSSRGRDDDDDDDKPRKRKRSYHDDDDDDDDRPRRRPQQSGGGAGKVLAIVGGVLFLLLLVCGGAFWGIYRLMASAEDAINDQNQQMADAFNNAAANQGGFPGGNPFINERRPADMAEALTFLKGNEVGARVGAANWLASQPVDAGKRKEVATALEGLVKDSDDNVCIAGAKAMKVWGTQDNGPALTTALKSRMPAQNRPFLNEDQKQLMGAIAQVKYVPGAEVICEFLPNFFSGGEAEVALGNFGATAEPAVLKWYNHPDGNGRGKARSLCVRYNTKPLAILDQTISDLNSPDRGRSGAALEWLSRLDSNEALQAAKADPARRNSVAVALNKVLDDSQTNGDQALAAARRWATDKNVPALVRRLETDPWKKKDYADVLIAIGPACEAEVKPLLTHRDGGVVNEARRILNAVGSPESKSEAIIADLKSENAGRIREAARTLQTTKVDEKQRAAVAAALLETMSNTGPGRTDGDCALDVAKAFVVWGTKDDAGMLGEKLRNTTKFFTKQSRPILFEWMGKQKAEKAIPFLAGALADKDDYQAAGKALVAMGPDLGDKVEDAVWTVQATDAGQITECLKVIGAVGTKKSLPQLKLLQARYLQQKNVALAVAAKDAADAITIRGK